MLVGYKIVGASSARLVCFGMVGTNIVIAFPSEGTHESALFDAPLNKVVQELDKQISTFLDHANK